MSDDRRRLIVVLAVAAIAAFLPAVLSVYTLGLATRFMVFSILAIRKMMPTRMDVIMASCRYRSGSPAAITPSTPATITDWEAAGPTTMCLMVPNRK